MNVRKEFRRWMDKKSFKPWIMIESFIKQIGSDGPARNVGEFILNEFFKTTVYRWLLFDLHTSILANVYTYIHTSP